MFYMQFTHKMSTFSFFSYVIIIILIIIILIKIIKNIGTMLLGEMVSCPFSNKQKLIIIWFVIAKTRQTFNHILILI